MGHGEKVVIFPHSWIVISFRKMAHLGLGIQSTRLSEEKRVSWIFQKLTFSSPGPENIRKQHFLYNQFACQQPLTYHMRFMFIREGLLDNKINAFALTKGDLPGFVILRALL